MKNTQEIFYIVFVPNNQPPEVLKPGKPALYLPFESIASEFADILGDRFFAPFAMWCNHFDTTAIKELIVKFIAVVSDESRAKFKDKVRQLTRRNNPLSMHQIIQDLNEYLRG